MVLLPNLGLAFEYQGETHYFSSHLFGRATDRQSADQIKRQFAGEMGITLISIPFWWDKLPNSLIGTIQLHRPDIYFGNLDVGDPIPSELPLTMKPKKKALHIGAY